MFKHTLSIVASATLVASLGAQTLTIEPITVTAGAHENNELNAPYAIEVYTKEDIQKSHVQNIYEFLNQSTSIITIPGYGNPFAQKIDMHGYGADGYQNIVVLLNGRRLNNIDMTSPLLSSIPLNAIERIEITKGSGSVTAGDGANAGVINILTSATGANALSLYGGTYGTKDGTFNINKNTDTIRLNVAGEAYNTNGTRRIDADGNKDEKSLVNGTFNLAYTPNNDLEIRLGGDFSNMDTIYGGSLTLAQYNDDPSQSSVSNTHQKFSTRAVNTGFSYDFSQNLTLNADLSHEKKTSNYITYSSVSHYTYDSAKANTDYKNNDFTLRTGVDGFKGERQGNVNLEKNSVAAFVTGALALGKDTLQLGYRFEKVSYDNKKDWNKNEDLHGADVGFNHFLTQEQSVFFNYSHSYQSADIDRLFSYSTGNFTGYVDPMQAHNFTVGYNFIQPNNKLKVSAYYTDLKNEIYYYAAPLWINTNIDKSHKYGLDFYDQLIINDQWNALINYNYVQAIIDEEIQSTTNYANKKLPGVSDHNVKVALTYLPNPATALSITQLYRSKAYAANDFNNNFSQKQEAYTSTNIGVTYTQKDYELFVKINNLFNQSNGIWIRDNAIYPVDFTITAIAGVKFIF
ncbi:MAG: TonB-dependent receptor [Sulfuricurvum sp.]|nr:TonB-dependent receptor [Sulfuricurvum sp.]